MSFSVSASSSLPRPSPADQSPAAASSETTLNFTKAPNGYYLQPNYLSEQTPYSADGYKPLPLVSTAATISSPAVQSAVINLVKGG
jgi:hypothetical protein